MKQLTLFESSILEKIKSLQQLATQSINRSFILGIILGILLSLLVDFSLDKPKYAYLDIELVVARISQKLHDEKNINEAIESHKAYFKGILDSYSQKHALVIFSSLRPIAGAIDITDYFVKEMVDFSPPVSP